MPRRFAGKQRVALYLSAGGRCAICGAQLERGWHADQVTTEQAGRRWDTPDNLITDNVMIKNVEQGNAATYALRRLRKNRADLHAKVLANELSPHAAMVEAGFRERTVQVPLDVTRAARVLRRHFTKAEICEIARLATD